MAQQHRPGDTRECDVALNIRLSGTIGEDRLATLAENILEAVQTYAMSCVDGPAVGYKATTGEIELCFTTDADCPADIDGVVHRVRQIIEGETPLQFTLDKRTAAV
ncbi:MAG: hypothetical protein QOG94_2402 [Solirubrobacteraceae bacterium]|nr:hypothetical protein [Solirubrobacteraceae bacterium]